jgi:hemerythrin
MSAPIERASDFLWTDEFKLGFNPIDDTHQEFVALVQAMLSVGDAEFLAVFYRFADHARRHFEQEKEWMSSGDFHAKACHVEEHDKVLASLRQAQPLIEQGCIDIGRSLAKALAEWFPGHADHMDSALATWMVKRFAGGSPVVLKRNVQRSPLPGEARM